MSNLSSTCTQFPNIFGSWNKNHTYTSCPTKANFRSFFAWWKHFAFSPDTVTTNKTKQCHLSLLTALSLLNIQFQYLEVRRCFYGRVLHIRTTRTKGLLLFENLQRCNNWITMVSFFYKQVGNVISKKAKEQYPGKEK